MTITHRTGAVVAGLALTVTGLGGALAAESHDWYAGSTTSLADGHRSNYALGLYDASGAPITSGSTTTAIAAFAAADVRLAGSQTHAQVFAHLPLQGTASGAWPGVQATGTDQFTGPGAVPAPAGVTGKAYTRLAGGYTVADLVTALPNTATSASWAGVYELRLRTSSAAGVTDDYASTWIKVNQDGWQVTTAPVAGDSTSPTPPSAVASTVTPTWPAFTYGKAARVKVRVTAPGLRPSGDVVLSQGTTRISSARIASDGTATLQVAAGALAPGSRELVVSYAGVKDSLLASTAKRTVKVAKGKPGKPKVKVIAKPTSSKKGKVAVSVKTATGLAKATKKVTVTLKKGKRKVTVKATLKKGRKTVSLPPLARGRWKVTATYSGDSRYTARKATSTITVR